MLKEFTSLIKKDKLSGALTVFWLLTVAASFSGSALLSFSVPKFGEVFPFRILLPIVFILWFINTIKNKEKLLKNRPPVELVCYIMIGLLLVAGAVSVLRAIDFEFTLRKYLNLCYDLCFFFLVLRLCSDKTVRKLTVQFSFACLCILCLLGVYEVFFNGIVNDKYDNYERFTLFNKVFQSPLVFSENTNDYNSIILFVYALVMLDWLRPGKKIEAYKAVSITLLGCILFFLISAGGSRLCLLGFFALIGGVFLRFILGEKKLIAVPAVIILSVLFTLFANNYTTVMPSVREFFNPEPTTQPVTENPSDGEQPATETPTEPATKRPSFSEELFVTEEGSGKQTINTERSGGIRLKMLIHSFNCFKESYGLGVGLGNTEQLAKSREVIPNSNYINIHCFIARMIADFGIFFLIPMLVIAFFLLKYVFSALVCASKNKNITGIACSLFIFAVLLMYPIVSTSSSDAQDILSMWLYLGIVVVVCTVGAQSPAVSESTPAIKSE